MRTKSNYHTNAPTLAEVSHETLNNLRLREIF